MLPTIITAADKKYFIGLQYLIQSINQNYEQRDVTCINCINLGLTEQQVSWLKKNKVKIIKPPKPIVNNSLHGWQKWNKPQYIELIAKKSKKVIWIDSDCILLDKLDFIERMVNNIGLTVFADTAGIRTYGEERGNLCLRNRNHLGVFKNNEYPNNGIIGFNFNKSKDKEFLLGWLNNTKKAEINHDYREELSCYDQGVFQYTLEEQRKTDYVIQDSRYNFPVLNQNIENIFDLRQTLFNLKQCGIKIAHFINKAPYECIKFDDVILNSLKRRFFNPNNPDELVTQTIRRSPLGLS